MLAILASSFIGDSQIIGDIVLTPDLYAPFVHLFGNEMTLTALF